MEVKISMMNGTQFIVNIDKEKITEEAIKEKINKKYHYPIDCMVIYKVKESSYMLGFFGNEMKNSTENINFQEKKGEKLWSNKNKSTVKVQKDIKINEEKAKKTFEHTKIFNKTSDNYNFTAALEIQNTERTNYRDNFKDIKDGIKTGKTNEEILKNISDDSIDFILNDVQNFMGYILFDN